MSLSTAAAMAQDYQVQHIVTAAITRTAVSVVDEDPETEGHAARAELAEKVLTEPGLYAARFSWVVSTDDDLVTAYGENGVEGIAADVQEVVDDLWSAVAGVATPEA